MGKKPATPQIQRGLYLKIDGTYCIKWTYEGDSKARWSSGRALDGIMYLGRKAHPSVPPPQENLTNFALPMECLTNRGEYT